MPPARAVLRVLLAAAVLSVAGGEAGTCDPDNEAWNAETLQCEPLQLSCSNCEKGFYFDTTTASCIQCAELETTINVGASDTSECVCAEGAGGTPCAQCTWDAYSDEEADTECKQCPANTGTNYIGKHSEDDCLCFPGYEEASTSPPGCSPCNAGYHKSSPFTGTYTAHNHFVGPPFENCIACPENTYSSSLGTAECNKCPFYSTSNPGSSSITDCQCADGFGIEVEDVIVADVNLKLEFDRTTDSQYLPYNNICGYMRYKHASTNNDFWYLVDGFYTDDDVLNVLCRSLGLHSGFKGPGGLQRRHVNIDLTTNWRYVKDVNCNGNERDIDDCILSFPDSRYGDLESLYKPMRVCCVVEPGSTEAVESWQYKRCEKCNAGYVAVSGSCTACDAGKYSLSETRTDVDVPNMPPGETSVVVNTACVNCPPDSTSPDASADVNDCKCRAGYEGTLNYLGNCIQCQFGKFRTEEGPAPQESTEDEKKAFYACDDCPANKVAVYDNRDDEYFRRTEEEACVSCPTGSTTQGRTAVWAQSTYGCMCNKGYSREGTQESYFTPTGHNCKECAAGKYKHWVSNPYDLGQDMDGNWICTGACLPDTIAEFSNRDASQACLPCVAGKYSTALGAITEGVCQECERGAFSDSPGSTVCSSCPQGTYQGETGATQCTACPLNSYTTTATDSSIQQEFTDIAHCRCQPGYWFDSTSIGSECQLCPAGSYCDNNDKTPCSGNTYSTAGASECTACPVNSVIPDGGVQIDEASCKCNVGYFGPDGGPCQECPNGEIKNTIGSDPCVQCAAGKFSFGLSECKDCMENSHSNAGIWDPMDCTCNAGYERKFQEGMIRSVDMIQCDPCPVNQYCIGNNFARDCPPQSTSPIGSDSEHDCTCNGGYYSVNRTHTETNTFLEHDTNSDHYDIEHDGYVHDAAPHDEPHKFCASCFPNYYYCTGDEQIRCPDNTMTLQGNGHASSARDCLCQASYWRNGCTRDWQDPQPYVRHVYETGVCTEANLLDPADHTSKVDDELNTDDAYIGSFWREQSVTVDAVQKCQRLELCNITGSFFEQACTQCPGDIYCSVGTTHTVSAHCPEHSTAQPGSDHIDDCKCLAGYKRITR